MFGYSLAEIAINFGFALVIYLLLRPLYHRFVK